MPHAFANSAALSATGFQGFISIASLRATALAAVPRIRGVYAVVRDPYAPPKFLPTNSGGRFKGRDPTVAVSDLHQNWVDKAVVIYLGKAGGKGSKATLQGRLRQLLHFGGGRPVGHWGGRYLWQLGGIDAATICWRALEADDPRTTEADLIQHFVSVYGKRPYGNLVA